MRIVKRGPKNKEEVETFKFQCHSCKSILKAKSYEFRRFGFKNNLDDTNPGYVFMCPVCNCQRVVRASELKKVVPVSSVVVGKVDKALGMMVKKIERQGDEEVIQNEC